jgi:type IV pilus assembly protein PilX
MRTPSMLHMHARRNDARGPGTTGQQGAVLIVGLIILVVLTLLGVQAMRTNVAQERMAGNMRERNVAFQAAEAVLRVGERTGPFAVGNTDIVDTGAWDGTAPVPSGSIAAFDDGVAADPIYHVGPPQYIRIGLEIPATFRYIYPVTARGAGGQASTVVTIQSGFEPPI